MNDVRDIRLSDLLYAIAKRWKMILALTVLGIVLGVVLSGISYLQGGYTNYVIRSSIVITPQSNASIYNGNYGYSAQTDFHFAEEMVDAVRYVLTSDRVLNSAIESTGILAITSSDVSRNLTVSQYNETQILELSLRWSNPDEGVTLMNAILNAFKVNFPEAFLFDGTLTTIDEPKAYNYAYTGINSSTWIIMILLGPLVGLGIAVLELFMRPTLLNLRDVEVVFGLETLGVIPKNDAYFRSETLLLEGENDPNSTIDQNYASSAYILNNRMGTKERHHCFYVTSTEDGEGKSTVTANLAIQLADMGRHVLLIDLNTRNPSLSGMFLHTVDYERTLNAIYKGEATAQDAIVSLTGYLDFLPTVLERTPVPIDATLLDFIRSMQKNYEYVVIDAPCISQAASEVFSLNQAANTALFVIRYDTVPLHDIDEAIDKLDKSGVRIVGCIVNASQANPQLAFWSDRMLGNVEPRRMRKEPVSPAMGEEVPNAEENEDLLQRTKDGKEDAWKPKNNSEKPRSLLDELTDDYSSDRSSLTDAEALTALIQMGASGSWKKNASTEEPETEPADVPTPVKPATGPAPQEPAPSERLWTPKKKTPAAPAAEAKAAPKKAPSAPAEPVVPVEKPVEPENKSVSAVEEKTLPKSEQPVPEVSAPVEPKQDKAEELPVQEKPAEKHSEPVHDRTKKRSLFSRKPKPKH